MIHASVPAFWFSSAMVLHDPLAMAMGAGGSATAAPATMMISAHIPNCTTKEYFLFNGLLGTKMDRCAAAKNKWEWIGLRLEAKWKPEDS